MHPSVYQSSKCWNRNEFCCFKEGYNLFLNYGFVFKQRLLWHMQKQKQTWFLPFCLRDILMVNIFFLNHVSHEIDILSINNFPSSANISELVGIKQIFTFRVEQNALYCMCSIFRTRGWLFQKRGWLFRAQYCASFRSVVSICQQTAWTAPSPLTPISLNLRTILKTFLLLINKPPWLAWLAEC